MPSVAPPGFAEDAPPASSVRPAEDDVQPGAFFPLEALATLHTSATTEEIADHIASRLRSSGIAGDDDRAARLSGLECLHCRLRACGRAFRSRVVRLLHAIEQGEIIGMTSEMTLAEILVKPIEKERRISSTVTTKSSRLDRMFEVLPVRRDVLCPLPAFGQSATSVKLPDAIHLAICACAGLQLLRDATIDVSMRRKE